MGKWGGDIRVQSKRVVCSRLLHATADSKAFAHVVAIRDDVDFGFGEVSFEAAKYRGLGSFQQWEGIICGAVIYENNLSEFDPWWHGKRI